MESHDSDLGREMLIIIGMHRSGTSATTGALQCLGVQLGRRLYAGHQDVNAKGYFEHSDIADTNDEILSSLGSSWDDVLPREDGWWQRDSLRPFTDRLRGFIRRDFAHSRLWALKDPRLCRLLPLWLALLQSEGIRPRFLFVVRGVDDVYRSLHKRDRFSRDKSFMLWALHYLEAERSSRGYSRVVVSFDRFLEQPIQELRRIESQLGIRFPLDVNASRDRLAEFLSSDLRHHRSDGQRDASFPLPALAYEVEDHLLGLASAASAAEADSSLDDLADRLAEIQRAFDPVLVEHLRSSGRIAGDLQLMLNRVRRSLSWYVGKPIRFIERLMGRSV